MAKKKKDRYQKERYQSTRDRTIAYTGQPKKSSVSKGASKRNEHLHRKMRSGQPEISYNFPSRQAAKQLKAFERTIANAVRDSKRKRK